LEIPIESENPSGVWLVVSFMVFLVLIVIFGIAFVLLLNSGAIVLPQATPSPIVRTNLEEGKTFLKGRITELPKLWDENFDTGMAYAAVAGLGEQEGTTYEVIVRTDEEWHLGDEVQFDASFLISWRRDEGPYNKPPKLVFVGRKPR